MKTLTYLTYFFFTFLIIGSGEVEVGEYQLLTNLGDEEEERSEQGIEYKTYKCLIEARTPKSEYPPIVNEVNYHYTNRCSHLNTETNIMPSSKEPIDHGNSFMSGYNKQLEVLHCGNKEKREIQKAHVDHLKKKLNELDFNHYFQENKNVKIAKRGIKANQNISVLSKKINNLNNNKIKDISDVTKLINAKIKKISEIPAKKRSIILKPHQLKPRKICCNPEKPSIVLDSRFSPSHVIHIDRNIIEEIIEVDIPKNKCKNLKEGSSGENVECSLENKTHLTTNCNCDGLDFNGATSLEATSLGM